MTNSKTLNRSGLAAIAAAALLSTTALAQDSTPVPADPAPIVADTPLPAEPAATEAAPDALAPAATTVTQRPPATVRPTRATAAPAARPVRTVAPEASPANGASTASNAPAPAPVEGAAPFDPAMVAPLPETPAATPAPAPNDSMVDNDLWPLAGAAGLGILALAGAGYAMRRRRRNEDEMVEETYLEPVMNRAEPAPMAQAPIAAVAIPRPEPVATAPITASFRDRGKPAFNWGNAPRGPASSIDRMAAAKKGPTPDNPSLSLNKRLKRAAFFDQRDRAIAAGRGVPVSAMAGLPRALTNSA